MANSTNGYHAGNMAIEVEDKTVTITIDTSRDLGPSKSGKSTLVASTKGKLDLDEHGCPGLTLGLNLYRPRGR